MDKITTLTLVDDDRFLRATQEELPDIEYRTADGIVMKPKLKDGEIVGFTATGPDGGHPLAPHGGGRVIPNICLAASAA